MLESIASRIVLDCCLRSHQYGLSLAADHTSDNLGKILRFVLKYYVGVDSTTVNSVSISDIVQSESKTVCRQEILRSENEMRQVK